MNIPGVVLREIEVHRDDRGQFAEIFRATNAPHTFVQANHSVSEARVLRGMHFHRRQADLWYVTQGIARVALVDMRQRGSSPVVIEMDASRPQSLFIPPGVAHGYLALERVTMIYLVTTEYDSSDEFGIAWDDPDLAIPWGVTDPVLSERDSNNPNIRWDEIPSFS